MNEEMERHLFSFPPSRCAWKPLWTHFQNREDEPFRPKVVYEVGYGREEVGEEGSGLEAESRRAGLREGEEGESPRARVSWFLQAISETRKKRE